MEIITKNSRVFKRSNPFIGSTMLKSSVYCWKWTRNKGLYCIYDDGRIMKSEYTLNELLAKSKPEGDLIEY